MGNRVALPSTINILGFHIPFGSPYARYERGVTAIKRALRDEGGIEMAARIAATASTGDTWRTNHSELGDALWELLLDICYQDGKMSELGQVVKSLFQKEQARVEAFEQRKRKQDENKTKKVAWEMERAMRLPSPEIRPAVFYPPSPRIESRDRNFDLFSPIFPLSEEPVIPALELEPAVEIGRYTIRDASYSQSYPSPHIASLGAYLTPPPSPLALSGSHVEVESHLALDEVLPDPADRHKTKRSYPYDPKPTMNTPKSVWDFMETFGLSRLLLRGSKKEEAPDPFEGDADFGLDILFGEEENRTGGSHQDVEHFRGGGYGLDQLFDEQGEIRAAEGGTRKRKRRERDYAEEASRRKRTVQNILGDKFPSPMRRSVRSAAREAQNRMMASEATVVRATRKRKQSSITQHSAARPPKMLRASYMLSDQPSSITPSPSLPPN